jgi:hypothetical protein
MLGWRRFLTKGGRILVRVRDARKELEVVMKKSEECSRRALQVSGGFIYVRGGRKAGIHTREGRSRWLCWPNMEANYEHCEIEIIIIIIKTLKNPTGLVSTTRKMKIV